MRQNHVVFNSKDYQLINLIIDIDNGDIALPDLQRPFVWQNVKVRDLIDSLYKGLPAGVIILWEVLGPMRHRRINQDGKREPRFLVIDGQQRLTSLFSIIKNKKIVNKNFKKLKIKIAFNPVNEKFEVSNPALEKDPEWIADISEIFNASSSHFFLKNYFNRLSSKRKIDSELEDLIANRIERLNSIKNYPFSVLELSSDLDPEEVAEIFVRINSKGKSLNQSDFILTLMSVYWDEGRKQIEEFCEKSREISSSTYNLINIKPNPEHIVRTIVGYSFYRGRLKYAYLVLKGRDFENREFSEELREKNFEIFKKGQEKVLDLINWHDYVRIVYNAGFVNESLISSKTTFFVNYILYLLGKEKLDHKALERIIRKWLVFSLLTQRYTGSPESTIEQDLLRIKNSDFVNTLHEIMNNELTESFWDITLPNSVLDTSSVQSFAYLIYNAALIFEDKKVLFSYTKLRDIMNPFIKEKKKTIDKHHIFPVNYLKKLGIRDRRLINQIANFIFLEYKDNIQIGDKSPDIYWDMFTKDLSEEEKEKIFEEYDLPKNFWMLDYETFLKERRKLMAKRIRKYFESL